MKYIYHFLILFLPVFTSAQSIQLRGKVIDTDKQPVSNISLRFTSFGDAVTTNSGEFVIAVPQTVLFVDVVIRDDKRQLLYPVDSKIPLPADPNYVTTIIVSGGNTVRVTSTNESIIRFTELESLLKEVGTTHTELQAFLEKFIELEARRFEVSESRFRVEFERELGRGTIFTEIARSLKNYILRAGNLKTNFEMYFELAFVSNPAVENLNKAIGAYNPVFDSIYNNYNNWKAVISLARDSVSAESFASSVNYMIDEIHTPYIFQLNECVKLINEIKLNIGKVEEKKREVRDKVSLIMQNLDLKIPMLESRFDELSGSLLHAGMN